MKNRDVLSSAFLFLSLSSLASGCAAIGLSPAQPAKPMQEESDRPTSRTHSLMELELALEQEKGAKVAVPRKLLEDILRAELTYKQKCERLSTQLEALKSIDAADPRGMEKQEVAR